MNGHRVRLFCYVANVQKKWLRRRVSTNCGLNSRYKFDRPPGVGSGEGTRSSTTIRDYLLLAFPITSFGLGVWQTQRRTWKLDLIKHLDERTSEPPIPLPPDDDEVKSLEYRSVHVTGTFDHAREVYIGPRSLRVDDGRGGLFGNADTVGWHVITPFRLADSSGETVLVNRGWVPKKKLNPASRPEPPESLSQVVDLVGVVRLTEPRQNFTPKNNMDSNRMLSRDVEALSAKLGTRRVFLDADASSGVVGGPIGGQTRVTLRNEHLSYMLTWYSLSAATFYMWFKRFGPK